jgi:hypothetical protein
VLCDLKDASKGGWRQHHLQSSRSSNLITHRLYNQEQCQIIVERKVSPDILDNQDCEETESRARLGTQGAWDLGITARHDFTPGPHPSSRQPLITVISIPASICATHCNSPRLLGRQLQCTNRRHNGPPRCSRCRRGGWACTLTSSPRTAAQFRR